MLREPGRSGFTLLELAIALALVAALLGAGAIAFSRLLDRYAVRAARDALAAGFAHARAAAIAHGGASLVVELPAARFRVDAAGAPPAAPLDLHAQYRVTLSADGLPADSLVFRFDALGIGRMTSRTFRIRRGHAEAGLTVAAYGRIRRW
ncbi:MAG TPA: prepilin-type N-terminal cleavage/methylation domain-containing protein [Longimicrobiales bacterium]